MFPAKFDRYIEVFGWGGWVLFGKPPDARCMEVYNDFNSNLANLFYRVKNRPVDFLRELGFLPINSRDEFTVIRDFLDKQEFDLTYLRQEMELAERYLPPPDYEEIRAILLKNAEVTDVCRAAAFFKLIRYSYGSGCTSYGCQSFEVRKCFDAIWQTSRRLANTVVENKDFEALIRQYDREREKAAVSVQGDLLIPQALLDAAGIPQDSGLTVEVIPGVLLIALAEPLKQANRPYLKLFSGLGIEPEEVNEILREGGYFQ